MADDSQLDQSKEHAKHKTIANRWQFLYYVIRDVGIVSTIAGAALGMFYMQSKSVQEEAKEDKKFIRTELIPMVRDGTKANEKVAESLEDFVKTSTDLSEVLEDLTKEVKKENAK